MLLSEALHAKPEIGADSVVLSEMAWFRKSTAVATPRVPASKTFMRALTQNISNLSLAAVARITFRACVESQLDRLHIFAIIEVMMRRSYLGEFELMLLLVVIHLGEDAYGVPISRELELHRRRSVSVGSVYAALERLEAKGLITSSLGDPTAERGGKAKRYFRITRKGICQVRETRRVLTKLWQVIPDYPSQT